MTVIPQTENLTIVQGSDFVEQFFCVEEETDEVIDITGYTARMHVRATKESPDVLLEFTTENGRIVIDGPSGSITIRLSPTSTGAVSFEQGVYDLELDSGGGHVYRPVEGKVFVNFQTTR